MSRPPWVEQATVWLAPSQVGLLLRRRGWRSAWEAHAQAVPGAAQGDGAHVAHAALHALERLAAVAAPAQARARIVLSNRFVRWTLLPDGRALRNATERALAARALLRGVHGEAVDGWQLAVDDQAVDRVPAVALDAAWLELLQRRARHAGLTPLSVRPLLALAAAQAWHALAGQGWLLVTEPDGAGLARIAAPGGWQSLRSLAFDGTAAAEALLPWLARCALLDGLEPDALPLVHVDWQGLGAPGPAPAWTEALRPAGWRVQALALDPQRC